MLRAASELGDLMICKRGFLAIAAGLFGAAACSPAESAGSQGGALAAARDSEFFKWFHLTPSHAPLPAAGGQWMCFRPESAEMRPMVEIAALTDGADRILASRLSLDRRFIDGRSAPFARDIAKSFLQWAGPRPRGPQLALIIGHMEVPTFGLRGGTVLYGAGAPKAPAQPDETGFLDAYLGRRTQAEFAEGGAQVRAVNVAGVLPDPAASVEPVATPGASPPAEAWLSIEARL